MTKVFILFFSFWVFSYSNAQNFEGKITYLHLINSNLSETSLKRELFIKKNKSKAQYYFDEVKSIVYVLNIENNDYHVNSIEGKISKDISPANKDIAKKLNKREVILGYICSIYKKNRNTPFGKDVTFYSVADSLKAESSNSSKKVLNGRIVLKTIQKTKDGTYIDEAIKLEEIELSDSIFKLPDYPIKEVNFDNLTKKYIGE